jgi:hypothetical protein
MDVPQERYVGTCKCTKYSNYACSGFPEEVAKMDDDEKKKVVTVTGGVPLRVEKLSLVKTNLDVDEYEKVEKKSIQHSLGKLKQEASADNFSAITKSAAGGATCMITRKRHKTRLFVIPVVQKSTLNNQYKAESIKTATPYSAPWSEVS